MMTISREQKFNNGRNSDYYFLIFLPGPGKPTRNGNALGSGQDIGCCGAWFTLPWEGIIKLALTGLGIVVSVAAGAASSDPSTPTSSSSVIGDEYVGNVRYATVYLFFALSGLVDILVYYCGYSVLPEGIQSFILSLAFSVEALLFAMRLR